MSSKALIPIPNDIQKYIWPLYKKLQYTHWLSEEIPYDDDILPWSRLESKIKTPLIYINAFFVNADSEITGIIEDKLRCYFIDNQHIQAIYSAISSNEFVHNEVYSMYVHKVLPKEDYKYEILADTFKFKIDKMAWINHKYKTEPESIGLYLILQIINEGLFFNSSFCIIKWVSDYMNHILPTLNVINDFVSSDEGLHTELSIVLYNHYIDHKLSQDKVYELFNEAIEVEYSYLDSILEEELDILTRKNIRDHVEHVANTQIKDLGYPAMKETQTVFGFMYKHSIRNRMSDFFTCVNTDYRKFDWLSLDEYSNI